MKQRYFQKAEFRKYSLYAIGETALLIVGILIALQIDNWNTEKVERAALESYLQTISRNIGSDLELMNEIRTNRIHAYELGVRWLNFGDPDKPYAASKVVLATEAIDAASSLYHFNASTSGYDALKASGILIRMQGTAIEWLLFDYYDTVAKITLLEEDLNDDIRETTGRYWDAFPADVEFWEIASPNVIAPSRFEELQPHLPRILRGPRALELFAIAQSTGSLLLEYDKLDRLGRTIRHLVEQRKMDLDSVTAQLIEGIYEPGSGSGFPDLIVDGQISWHAYVLLNSDANDPRISSDAAAANMPRPFDVATFRPLGDSLRIDYAGGAEWAGIWFAAGDRLSRRLSPDFSKYDKLVLELRGETGGETFLINMEDAEDPSDGSSSRIEVRLSDDWQTYELDLAEFETANLEFLSVPLGLIFDEDPVSFSIRNARFVEAD